MSFFLSETNEHVRLKSYDATIKGGKTTLRITVEVTDPYELSFLRSGQRTMHISRPCAARPLMVSRCKQAC